MTSIRRVLAVAAFEARLTRRLVRTWILGTLALGLPLLTAGQYLFFHHVSGFSGAYALMTRDFWVLQPIVFLGMSLGILGVFFAFDWRHRDTSAAFSPAFDAAPLSRLELAWGKFLGLCPWMLWPFAVLLVAQLIAGLATRTPVSPSTYLVALFQFGLPGALVPTAIAFGVAGLTGGRAAAIVAGLLWTAAILAVTFGLPEEFAIIAAGYVDLPVHSLFVGYQADSMNWVHALALIAMVGLFITLAACGPLALPRNTADRTRRVALAGALGVVVVASLAGTWWLYREGTRTRQAVIAAERAVAGRPEAAVVRRDIDVTVGGGRLDGIARITVRNETPEALSALHFRLNAGLALQSVTSSLGNASFERDLSVVTLTPSPPLQPGDERTLEFRYGGTLDAASVDADRALATRKAGAQLRGIIRLMGSVAGYLDRDVVALGTDAGWYPESGMTFGFDYPARATQWFAPSTLVVHVPSGWKAASVGLREDLGDGGFRFTCDEPVPGLSLNAAAYEELESDVGGVHVRVLHHPAHGRNVEFFREAAPVLQARAVERLEEIASRTGLTYPYPELTFVEVPQAMAAFGAGWDTPNRLGAPGVVMMREGAILGARFGLALKSAKSSFKDAAGGKDDGDEMAAIMGIEATQPPKPATADDDDLTTFNPGRSKADILRRFVISDWTGGDVERLAFRSLWDHRVHAVGREAPVTGLALSQFQAEVALGRSVIDTPEVGRVIANQGEFQKVVMASFVKGDVDMTRVVVEILVSLDDVYSTLQATPLEKIDPAEDPAKFVGVLYVKGRRPLQALRTALGSRWNEVGQRLIAVPGHQFDWQDFRAAVLEVADPQVAPALAVLLDNWLSGTQLPGFVVTSARVQRLAGEAEQWQVTARVSNRGDAAGIAKLEAFVDKDAHAQVVAVGAGEDVIVGLVLPRKPDRWVLTPFLAMNRDSPNGTFEVDEEPVEAERLEGVAPALLVATGEAVVVDNLDAGFTLTLADGQETPYATEPGEKDLLKDWSGWNKPSKWSRWRGRGRYRPFGLFDYTSAVKRGTEEGEHPARWRSPLPAPGTYRVEAYLPTRQEKGRGRMLAETHVFVIKSEAGDEEVSIDLSAPEPGWVDLGRFRFGRDAEVILKDRGDGLIVADAVRFVPEAS